MSSAQQPVIHRPDLPDTAFHRASAPFMHLLRDHGGITVVAVIGLAVLAGFLPAFAWAPLLVVTLFLVWVLAYSWYNLAGVEKLMRIAVIVLFVALTIVKAFPR